MEIKGGEIVQVRGDVKISYAGQRGKVLLPVGDNQMWVTVAFADGKHINFKRNELKVVAAQS